MVIDTGSLLFIMVGGIVSMVFQVAVVGLGVIIAWRWLYRPGGAATPAARPRTPVDVLAARYARGD